MMVRAFRQSQRSSKIRDSAFDPTESAVSLFRSRHDPDKTRRPFVTGKAP